MNMRCLTKLLCTDFSLHLWINFEDKVVASMPSRVVDFGSPYKEVSVIPGRYKLVRLLYPLLIAVN